MDYQEAIQYLGQIQQEDSEDFLNSSAGHMENRYTNHGSKEIYSLDRVLKLAELMGRPDKKLRLVHIAGTNGKGSVGAYMANALAMSGYQVGRYISPVLFDYRERIQQIIGHQFGVDEKWISEEEVAAWVTEIAKAVKQMEVLGFESPTVFEIETVMAFCQMAAWGVDVGVIEVGMGGDMDATNIIERPVITVFTQIDRDHMAYLGDTPEEVAEHKLGIIKAGVPVVSIRQIPEVQEKLWQYCQQKGLKLQVANPEKVRRVQYSLQGTVFYYDGNRYELSQLGCYQTENAITAIEALSQMKKSGFQRINISSMQTAFRETKWPGRFEVISKNPFLLLDGAHNAAGAAALKRSLETYFLGERFTYIFGVFRDKDYQGILEEMLPLAKRVITIRAVGSRGMDPEELTRCIREICFHYNREVSVKSSQGIEAALQEIKRNRYQEKIVVFGSLSFLHQVYGYFHTGSYIRDYK